MKTTLTAVMLSCLSLSALAGEAPMYSAHTIDHQCDRLKAAARNILASRSRGTTIEQARMLNGGSSELNAVIDKVYGIPLPKTKAEREVAGDELADAAYNDCQQTMVGRLKIEDEASIVKQ